MRTILASVGRGGLNRSADVRVVQELLNRHIRPPQPPLVVDGAVSPRLVAAIEAFQRRVVQTVRPDGRVDPGGRTFAALVTPAAQPATALPPGRGGAALTQEDLARAAHALACEVACIQAVTEVESGGSGFLPSGRPRMLFEAHIFARQTQHQYDHTHPDISSPTWNRALYRGGEAEYERLEAAIRLDRLAALASASWGRFQIMGGNYHRAGFPSVEAFVTAMFESESQQLDSFVRFLQHQQLDAPLRDKRWAEFAQGYNGVGYAANQYDVKLQAAYERYHRA